MKEKKLKLINIKLPKIFYKESPIGIWFAFVTRNWN
jgi:hypothetical protein